jgi:hypothetical protein
MPPEVAAAIEKNKKIIEEANVANKEKANEEKADNNAS